MRWLGADLDKLSRANTLENFKHLGDEWTQAFDAVVDGDEDNDWNGQRIGVLLELQISVAREEDVEFCRRLAEQHSIIKSRPAAPLNGLCLMPTEF
jgi:hypothetical protein